MYIHYSCTKGILSLTCTGKGHSLMHDNTRHTTYLHHCITITWRYISCYKTFPYTYMVVGGGGATTSTWKHWNQIVFIKEMWHQRLWGIYTHTCTHACTHTCMHACMHPIYLTSCTFPSGGIFQVSWLFCLWGINLLKGVTSANDRDYMCRLLCVQ